MMNSWFQWRRFAPVGALMLAVALAPLGLAQMGGGGMMGGGMMGDGMTGGGMMGGGGFMNGGMMNGNMMWSGIPAVGPDGSAYVIRRSGAGYAQSPWGGQKAELLAVSPKDGTPRLLASFEGTMISQPAASRDGRIFVTTSEPGNWWSGNDTAGTNLKPALIIVAPNGQTRTVTMDADYVSAPRVADELNGYVVYVLATQTGYGTFLYGFSGDGSQRFKMQLTQN